MSIERIDADLCNGCGICLNTCAADVIRIDEQTKKAKIIYPDDCSMCMMCEMDCPQHAVYVSPVGHTPIATSFGL